MASYRAFLQKIGYLVPNPKGAKATTTNVDAELALQAGPHGARLLLLGGAVMDGPRHIFWNFVSSSRERINQAKEDWRGGSFALPPDDHDEYIPLPEVPKTVSYP